MPIMNPDQNAAPAPAPVPIQIVDQGYRGAAVDSRKINIGNLLPYVEGSSVSVQYYQQVLGADEEPIGLELTRSPENQQYILVNRFELKVTRGIEPRQRPKDKLWETSGSANIYPSLIPNVGDMMLMDIGDGRQAIMQVSASEQKSVMSKTTYAIDFVLVNENPDWVANLNSKVIKQVYFVRDYAVRGSNPILESEDYQIVTSLSERFYDIVQEYFRTFYSRELGTMVLPAQTVPIYDPFIMTAFGAFFDTTMVPDLIYMRNVNVNDDESMYADTLWRALARREPRLIEHAAWKMGLVSRAHFRSQGMLEGIYYSRITYVVFPKDAEDTPDQYMAADRQVLFSDYTLKNKPRRNRTLQGATPNNVLDGFPQYSSILYKPVLGDEYYVFSGDFYAKTENRSALEIITQDYLDGRELNHRVIFALAEGWRAMDDLERFYYGPIILILIKSALGAI